MKKLIKWIVGLGTVGTAIGLLTVRLIKKSKSTSSDIKADSTDSNKEETDSDTFDLDQDIRSFLCWFKILIWIRILNQHRKDLMYLCRQPDQMI